MPFAATWTQLEIIILSEVSQKEKEKYQVTSLICATLSMAQMDLSTYEQKQVQGHREQTCVCQRGGGLVRDGVGGWG